jgi:DNA modification methylase
MNLILGDCIEELRKIKTASVDAIVTDPPYGWRFMGKAWDGADIERRHQADKASRQQRAENDGEWRICSDGRRRRRAKGLPGGLAADAGSYDFSVTGNQAFQNFSEEWAREAWRVLKPGGHMLVFCGPRTYHRMACGVEDAGFEIRDQLQWLFGTGFPKSLNLKDVAPGFGTALKPANEPILLARKPLSEKTVAANVLKWGTGGLNIDGCRISASREDVEAARVPQPSFKSPTGQTYNMKTGEGRNGETFDMSKGRFPANLILDETAAEMLDAQSVTGASRFFYVAKASRAERNAGLTGLPTRKWQEQGFRDNDSTHLSPRAGAGRTSENQNHHPTVKPITLMRYLCRLITPPNGVILDPFMGSGTTGIAAAQEGFSFIGIEREAEYFEIAKRRNGQT